MKLSVAGYERSAVWMFDPTTGAILGQSQSLANGGSSGAYVLDEVLNAEQAFAQFTDLEVNGGDRNGIAIHRFGNSRLQPFECQMSSYDTALNDLIQGMTTITSNPYAIETGQNPNRPTQQPGGFFVQQRAIDLDTGNQKYVTHIMSKALLSYRRGGAQYRGESDSVLSVAPVLSNRAFTGQAFGTQTNNINLGFTGNKTDHHTIITDYPIHLWAMKSDGTAVNFTLPYIPLSTVVTLGATPNVFTLNAVRTALSSVNISTGAIVLAAAGSAGNIGALFYTTLYTPS